MSSKVAVVRTTPESILADAVRAAELGGLAETLEPSAATILKNNLSWHLLYPAANTTPWQLEAAIIALKRAGFEEIACVENETVVTSAARGERLNKQRPVCEHYGVPILYNFKPSDMNWTVYRPKAEMLVLDEIFPDGIRIPDYFLGKNIVHLPTMKCHIYTNITGSMKNAFGGLLDNKRHYCHSRIHETLVDLLAIQKGDQERAAGIERLRGDRRRGRQDDGFRPDVARLHSPGPRTRIGSRSAGRYRDRRRRGRRRGKLGLPHR